MIEKPFATSLKDAREMEKLAKENLIYGGVNVLRKFVSEDKPIQKLNQQSQKG